MRIDEITNPWYSKPVKSMLKKMDTYITILDLLKQFNRGVDPQIKHDIEEMIEHVDQWIGWQIISNGKATAQVKKKLEALKSKL